MPTKLSKPLVTRPISRQRTLYRQVIQGHEAYEHKGEKNAIIEP